VRLLGRNIVRLQWPRRLSAPTLSINLREFMGLTKPG